MFKQFVSNLKARRTAARAAILDQRRRALLNSEPGVHPLPDDDPFVTVRPLMLFVLVVLILAVSTVYVANFGASTDTAAARLAELLSQSCGTAACDFATQWNGFVIGMLILCEFIIAAFIMIWAAIFTDQSDDDIIIDQQQQLDAIQQMLLDMKGNK